MGGLTTAGVRKRFHRDAEITVLNSNVCKELHNDANNLNRSKLKCLQGVVSQCKHSINISLNCHLDALGRNVYYPLAVKLKI